MHRNDKCGSKGSSGPANKPDTRDMGFPHLPVSVQQAVRDLGEPEQVELNTLNSLNLRFKAYIVTSKGVAKLCMGNR